MCTVMPVPRRSVRGRVKASVVLRAPVRLLPAPPGLRHLGDGASFRDGTFGGRYWSPARSLPSVALAAADSKSVTWTRGSCVAQAMSFPSLTALRSAGAAASGRSAQVTCPAASSRAPGDPRPGSQVLPCSGCRG